MTLNNIVKTCAWGLYKSDLRYPERTGWWSKVHPFAQTSSDQGECFVRRPVLCICLYHSVYQMSHQGKCFAFVRRPMLCICIIPVTKCCIRGNALRLFDGQCFVYVSFLLQNVASGKCFAFVRKPVLCICLDHSFYQNVVASDENALYEGQCFLSTRIFLVCA